MKNKAENTENTDAVYELLLLESKLSKFPGNQWNDNFSCVAIAINNVIRTPGERRSNLFSRDQLDKMFYATGNSGKKYQRNVYHIRFFCAEEVLDYLQTICDTGAIIEPAVKSWYLMEVYRSFSIVDGLFCSQDTYFTADTLQYTINRFRDIIYNLEEILFDLVKKGRKSSIECSMSDHALQMVRFYRQMRNGFSNLDFPVETNNMIPKDDAFEHIRHAY